MPISGHGSARPARSHRGRYARAFGMHATDPVRPRQRTISLHLDPRRPKLKETTQSFLIAENLKGSHRDAGAATGQRL